MCIFSPPLKAPKNLTPCPLFDNFCNEIGHFSHFFRQKHDFFNHLSKKNVFLVASIIFFRTFASHTLQEDAKRMK